MKKLYLLNSSILTSYGVYNYKEVDLEKISKMLHEEEIISAIGHQATAEILSELLGIQIPFNRINVSMETGDKAIVFKLKQRLEENKTLTKEEMKDLDYELGLLERLS